MDVFRRAEFCPDVAEQAAAAGAKALWLQLGIVSPEARAIAERAGMDYVENACTAIVHSLYLAGSRARLRPPSQLACCSSSGMSFTTK